MFIFANISPFKRDDFLLKFLIMRCDNCGWVNPDGVDRCQKCHQSLKSVIVEKSHSVCDTPIVEKENDNLNCDKCGKEYSIQLPSCPYCGFANPKKNLSVHSEQEFSNLKKTATFSAGELNNIETQFNDKPISNYADIINKVSKGVVDKSELKKTVVAEGFERNVENENVAAVQSKKFNQVVKEDLKATIVDSSKSILANEITANCSLDDTPENVKYSLLSIDRNSDTPIRILLVSSEKLELTVGDVLLIAKERYIVE